MRAAIHLHLFYPDVALELIGRIARIGRADIDVLATYVGEIDPQVDRALDRIPGRVVRIQVDNGGWDIGPLFQLLPRVEEEGYDVLCHLHTKKGDSGYAAEWRSLAYAGLIADSPRVSRILDAFAADPDMMIAGPATLYKSAAGHQFRNAEILSALAPRMVAPMYPLADWGFFAGTMFWARPAMIARVAAVARFSGQDDARDGTLAHAIERLFGLAPLATGGRIGLVEGDGSLRIVRAPGEPSHEPLIRTLVTQAERNAGPLDAELSAFIAAHNPLVDYIRHGRDADALDPNPYFSTQWYNRVHADVHAAGMRAMDHYIRHGAEEGRTTGPLFDGIHYRRAYEDVTGDPLLHFLQVGAQEGRIAIPASPPLPEAEEEGPRRFYPRFDIAAEEAFLRQMAELPADRIGEAAATRVSVIMPVYNRQDTVASAIRSVLGQTHANLELIVVDDGSTDRSRDVVRPFLEDARVRLIECPHGGVSAARNAALEHATGEVVAYLDSDNRWHAWFLDVMTRFLVSGDLAAGYSAISLRDDRGHLTGYRGDSFNWEACFEQNYIDLNAFCHRRSLMDAIGGFDPRLQRMVDWDLILRIGKHCPIGYAPFVGCDYHDGTADRERITMRQPTAYHALIRTKHLYGLEIGTPEFLRKLRLSFAIKIAAPADERDVWGDWHFAAALARAIRRLGHDVEIDCRGEWSGRPLLREDVAIVLRGLIPYAPRQGQISLLWNISHPDQVAFDEYDQFSRVYVASESAAAFLAPLVRSPVSPLLQATDPTLFHPLDNAPPGPRLAFCGNSRGVERPLVRWAIEAGEEPIVYGSGWDGLIPSGLVAAPSIDNRVLGSLYASSGAVLNDHWPSMAAFGFLSNRLFDIVAAGGCAVSDRVASMSALFGPAVRQVDDAAELVAAVDDAVDAPRPIEAARMVAQHHSFDARAARMVADVLAMLGLNAPFPVPAEAPVPLPGAPARPQPLRLHLIVPHGPHGPQSSAYIRLVAPLTDDSVAGRVSLSLGTAGDLVPPCDICIVQRAAMPSVAAVDGLADWLRVMRAKLVVDLDDAFIAIGPDHSEAAFYQPLNGAIDRLLELADDAWFSTAPLADAYAGKAGHHAVIANAIDPRLWRDWRAPPRAPLTGEVVRLLYMGTATHAADLAAIRPALDALAQERAGAFDLTLIGVAGDVAPAPWLRRLSPPADAITYPRFVRWLRVQGPFDVGLAPLVDTPFNRAKSDIKLLDYAALGLVPLVEDGPAYRADPVLRDSARFAGDWRAALRDILDNRDGARTMAAGAQAHVWDKRGVAGVASVMVERLEALR